ncbi:NAD(P)-dependent oxidoreductase, partial [Paraburkholderia sp.]|uniref:NAD(P)-dependent oxidoreductase n=1 Tax=Paraburkholderia sp. TaxID=1926495 RepID=UPI003C7D6826
MEIGFCGPGLMGAPMIRHLLRAGHTVHVWNRTRAKAEALLADGAQVVDTPRELASRCEAVLLCVADAAAVEETVFGADGLLSGDVTATRRVRWIIDHSSIPPAATRALARRAATVAGATAVSAAADEAQGGREREPEGEGATSVG